MTPARVALLLVAPLVGAAAAPALAQDRAFVEVEASRETCFVGETIDLTLRFGLDTELDVIQQFRRELGIPVRVEAPWIVDLPGTVAIGGPPEDGKTFALNDDVARARPGAERAADGRHYFVYEHLRSYRAVRAGLLDVFAVLQYSYATRFEEDFVNGRVALDPRTAEVVGEPCTITVRPLPDEGRPAAFTGGVGRFTVRATAAPGHVVERETLKLVLTIEGEGNLAALTAPRLDDLGGFHVYGALDDGAVPVRTITYDVSPQSVALTEIPAIAFAYFDPAPPAGYRTVHTEPIALTVRARVRLPGDPGGPPDVALPGAEGVFGAWLSLTLVGLAAAAIAMLVGLVLLLQRLRRRRLAALSGAPDPATAFRTRVAAPGAGVADALVDYLSARLGCPPASVIDPRLTARLTAAGAPDDLASRTAKLLEDLVGARYGGGAPAGSVEAARALVAELEEALSPRQSA